VPARATPLRLAAFALFLALAAGVTQGVAQQTGPEANAILTIATDRMFSDSAFGQRVAAEIEAQSAVLAAENRRIESELTAEEKDLTARRPDMQADAFRVLADAFDQQVQANREAQETKARALNLIGETARVDFLQAARPVLEKLMREAGAGVILERAGVFMSANSTDITDLAVRRIDAAIGDGTALDHLPQQ